MAEDTPIEWCDSTVNEMMGCDGCELWNPTKKIRICYAGVLTERYKGQKGYPESFDVPTIMPGRIAKALKWRDLTGTDRPNKPWLNGYPRIIFHGDLGDYWTESLPIDWLAPYVKDMAASPHIHLFLTKRPNRMFQFWRGFMDSNGGSLPPNFWLLTTVTTAEKMWRLKHLERLRDLGAPMLGVSFEPAWEAIDFRPHLRRVVHDSYHGGSTSIKGLDWIIFGGGSGSDNHPTNLDVARSTIMQCRAGGAAAFVKQLGSKPIRRDFERRDHIIPLRDRKGSDMCEWPEDLRVREMPALAKREADRG